MSGRGNIHGFGGLAVGIAREDVMKLLTVKDLQEILGIGRDMAYSLLRSNSFPSMKIGTRYFVSEEALAHWLKINENREIII